MKLSEILKYEKENMNKIRYIANYRVAPLYVLIVIICFIIVAVLMETDEIRYTPAAIGIFIFFGVITAALLASVPLTRKFEIKTELKRYDFDTKYVESMDTYEFSDEEVTVHFDKYGMHVNDMLFWYNHLRVIIHSSNYLNRIWIAIRFFINESDYIELALNGDTINMIEKFNIKLANREALDYIIHHKEEAFTKIYKTGRV